MERQWSGTTANRSSWNTLPQGHLRIADIAPGPVSPASRGRFRPDCSVILIEAHQRKAVFLREASRNLPNVRVLATRAEDVKDNSTGRFPSRQLRGLASF